MKIVDVKAYPTSFRVPKDQQVSLGIGTMTKRDCILVKVTTEDGIVRVPDGPGLGIEVDLAVLEKYRVA